MSTLAPWIDSYAARQRAAGATAPAWLATLRAQSLARFADEGWPASNLEAWRHTSLAVLAGQAFALPEQSAAATVPTPWSDADDGHWMVFVDGAYAPALSRIGTLPGGVRLQPLSQALAEAPDTIEAAFGDAAAGFSSEALNTALAADGAVLRLAQGAVLEETLHLVFIAATPGAASFARNLVLAEAGAQATILEHYMGHGSQASLTNTVTRLRLDADAHVTHLKLQNEDLAAFHLGAVDVSQGRGSVFNSHSMSFGARLARHDIHTDFASPGAEALLNGLYYVNGKRHVDHHTFIRHSQPHCVSREFYRGVLDDTARGVFGGRIYVAPGADKTDAIQRSDSLLLSRLAKADARPELEIYADDVKCAHGATVGQLDETSLFYLRSRGLDEAHARHVLTYAFAAEAISRIGADALRNRVIGAIRALAPAELGDLS
ncbi:Fe-S cluster assembly protein SufD [Pusillimonas sp. TS35]|nr:Fe-S cluster assembly protein SufD [Pusillimonas sp. TS35]